MPYNPCKSWIPDQDGLINTLKGRTDSSTGKAIALLVARLGQEILCPGVVPATHFPFFGYVMNETHDNCGRGRKAPSPVIYNRNNKADGYSGACCLENLASTRPFLIFHAFFGYVMNETHGNCGRGRKAPSPVIYNRNSKAHGYSGAWRLENLASTRPFLIFHALLFFFLV